MFLQILVKFWSGYGSLKFRVLGGYGGWEKFRGKKDEEEDEKGRKRESTS